MSQTNFRPDARGVSATKGDRQMMNDDPLSASLETLHEVSSFRTLDQVLSWALTRTPPAALAEVVTQDEFTHDVVIRVSNQVFLVFDTN